FHRLETTQLGQGHAGTFGRLYHFKTGDVGQTAPVFLLHADFDGDFAAAGAVESDLGAARLGLETVGYFAQVGAHATGQLPVHDVPDFRSGIHPGVVHGNDTGVLEHHGFDPIGYAFQD